MQHYRQLATCKKMPKKHATVYITKHCPHCHEAVQYLKRNNFAVRTVSLHSKKAPQKLFSHYTVLSAPVIVINKQVICGFSHDQLSQSIIQEEPHGRRKSR